MIRFLSWKTGQRSQDQVHDLGSKGGGYDAAGRTGKTGQTDQWIGKQRYWSGSSAPFVKANTLVDALCVTQLKTKLI